MSEPIEIDIPVIQIGLTEVQLDRIWQNLTTQGKATAIATVLVTHE